jgi:hypothetical protein
MLVSTAVLSLVMPLLLWWHLLTAGGWGPAVTTDPGPSIPNKDVLFLNNVLVNPSNESAMWAHFSVSFSPTLTNSKE